MKEMTFCIKPVQQSNVNLKGWQIVRSDGAALLGFTQKREVEQLIEFFTKPEQAKEEWE